MVLIINLLKTTEEIRVTEGNSQCELHFTDNMTGWTCASLSRTHWAKLMFLICESMKTIYFSF